MILMNILSLITTQVDSYCERIDFSLFSEPLNLYSNICFIMVALQVYIYISSRQKDESKRIFDKIHYIFLILIACIGIGSGLFHAFANRATMFLDVAPIGIYIIVYLWHWSYRLMRLSFKASVGLLALWGISTFLFTATLQDLPLGGSQSYISVALFLFSMGLYQKMRGASTLLLYSSICFLISLVFRSIDPYYCPSWPYGTHFLWHFLNSIVLSLSTFNALLLHEKPLDLSQR